MNRRAFLVLVLSVAFSPRARAGAWGGGSFDNDDALDWASTCAASRDSKLVSAALNAGIGSGYLEAPEGCAVIAAAEVVAAALGKQSANLPKELAAWVHAQAKEPLASLSPVALKAVARVLSDPKSELREMWKDTKDFAAWQSTLNELLARLK